MLDVLEELDGKASIGGRTITNLRFTDDIASVEEEQELEALVENLDKTCTRYKIKINADKNNDIQRKIKLKGQKLGTGTTFKYLRAFVSDECSKPEVISSTEQATTVLTKLKQMWRDNKYLLDQR